MSVPERVEDQENELETDAKKVVELGSLGHS